MKLRRMLSLLTCAVMLWTSVGVADVATSTDLPEEGQTQSTPETAVPEESAPVAPAEGEEQPEAPADPAEEETLSGYVTVSSGTPVYEDERLRERLGLFMEQAVVYAWEASDSSVEGVVRIAFCAEGEILTGYVSESRLSALTEAWEPVPDAVLGNIRLDNAAFRADEEPQAQP